MALSLRLQESMTKALDNQARAMTRATRGASQLANQTREYDRQQTKLLATLSQTKGVSVGMVFDMEMLGGAFKKVRDALSFMFSGPLVEGFWSGAFVTKPISAIRDYVKAKKQESEISEELGKIVPPFGDLESALTAKSSQQGLGTGSPLQVPLDSEGKPITPPPGATAAMKVGKGFMTAIKGAAKPAKFFNKQILKPLGKIAGAGIGLGFQSTVILGILQAFSRLFNVFQPVFDVLNSFIEIIGTGFRPIVTALLTEMTRPETMAMLMDFTQSLLELSAALAPLTPIIIPLIIIALIPLTIALKLLAAVITPFAPQIAMASVAVEQLNIAIGIMMFAINVMASFITKNIVPGIIAITGALKNFSEEINNFNPFSGDRGNGGSSSRGNTSSAGGRNLIDEAIRWATGQAAHGAFIKAGGGGALMLTGEGKHDEWILNEPQLRGIINEVAGSPEGGTSGQIINITVNGVAPGANLDELAILIGRKLGFRMT